MGHCDNCTCICLEQATRSGSLPKVHTKKLIALYTSKAVTCGM